MKPNFNKYRDGLIPVIIQNYTTQQVLMLGFMNSEAFEKTREERKVTFYSRSKKRLWTKGETSGHYLIVKQIFLDCDSDTVLIKAQALGATCHTGAATCFKESDSKGFVYELQSIIHQKIQDKNTDSYTYDLYKKGVNKIAQKVGEEATEVVIESKDDNKDLFINETADLLYHLLVLLRYKKVTFEQIEACLKNRHI